MLLSFDKENFDVNQRFNGVASNVGVSSKPRRKNKTPTAPAIAPKSITLVW